MGDVFEQFGPNKKRRPDCRGALAHNTRCATTQSHLQPADPLFPMSTHPAPPQPSDTATQQHVLPAPAPPQAAGAKGASTLAKPSALNQSGRSLRRAIMAGVDFPEPQLVDVLGDECLHWAGFRSMHPASTMHLFSFQCFLHSPLMLQPCEHPF